MVAGRRIVRSARRVIRGGRGGMRQSMTMEVARVMRLLVMIAGARVIAGLIFRFGWRRRRGLLIHILILDNNLRGLAILILVLIDDLLIVVIAKVVLVLIILKQKGVLVKFNNGRVI